MSDESVSYVSWKETQIWFVTVLHHISPFVGDNAAFLNAAESISRQIQQNVTVNTENVFTVILETKDRLCFVSSRREKTNLTISCGMQYFVARFL